MQEFDVTDLIRLLWKRKSFILKTTLICLCLGVLVVLLSHKQYTSVSTFIPQKPRTNSDQRALDAYLQKENPNIYKELEEKTNYLVDNIEKLAEKYGVDVCVNSMGSLFTIFFVDLEKVENLEDSLKANTENFSIYFNTMLDNGIVVPPSQFEAHFLSIAHTKRELDRTLEVMEMAFKKIGEKNA